MITETTPTLEETVTVEPKVVENVTPTEPVEEEVQEASKPQKNLRQTLIDTNKKVRDLEEENARLKSGSINDLPSSAVEKINSLFNDPEDAKVLLDALSELSDAQAKKALREVSEMTTKAEKDQYIQELEADNLMDELVEEFATSSIKVTQKDIKKIFKDEFFDEETENIIVPDKRSARLAIKAYIKGKEVDFYKNGESKQREAEKLNTVTQNTVGTKTRQINPRTGEVTYL